MKGTTLAAFIPAPARRLLRAGAFVFLWAAPASAANPSLSYDFTNMMAWLSHELAQGLAFNAGSTFDPPREVKTRRLQPDLSLGVGRMALNKKTFPSVQPALNDLNAPAIFPSAILFPNLVAHLRAGLPARMDLSIRFTDMTTPPGYKVSPTTTGKGQSNTIGVGVRKHFFGGEGRPALAVGANYNHVWGRFTYQTKFKINNIGGFSADSDVNGALAWAVNSFGLNGVVSQSFGKWTPFAGLGYNYATGSVRAHLQVDSQTPVIAPIVGEASDHPEANQGRVILGAQRNGSWMDVFLNGEIKALGQLKGRSWIVHAGVSLPFQIGAGGFYSAKAGDAPRKPKKEKKDSKTKPEPERGAPAEPVSEAIFIE